MMRTCGVHAQQRRRLTRKAAPAVVLAAAALLAGAGAAGAHGGDTSLVHSCIDQGGNVKIVDADALCKKNELALDWSRGDGGAGTTYTAGSGLALSPTNEFSVTGAPWSGLTGVPAGFADGVDDEGPALTWGNLTGIPSDLLDGDDDGSAAVGALRTVLGTDDGAPNEPGDLVSFAEIKDLTSSDGNGRITGDHIRDESVRGVDIVQLSITGDKIADGNITGAKIADETITGAKIADETIAGAHIAGDAVTSDHLAPGVLDEIMSTTTVDPGPIPARERAAVAVPPFFTTYDPHEITVVSPPPSLESGLVYAGSDVLPNGTLVVYLHNITDEVLDGSGWTWTVRQLRTGG